MASIAQQFSAILKTLRETNNAQEKCRALTCIRSNVIKFETSEVIPEDHYKEACKLIVEAFTSGDQAVFHDAYLTLDILLRTFKNHKLNLFHALLQINRKNRLKVFKFLEAVEDSAVAAAALDATTVNFFNDCMYTVQPNIMEWTTATACTSNLQMLTDAETRSLSDDQDLEEQLIAYALSLLQRLYKIALEMSDSKIERFDTLLMDKAVILAYMGHKRQRGPALKLLQQAILTNLGTHIRTKYSDVWSRYKSTLQNTYCTRMSLLVAACDPDWATQWSTSIQLLGTDLHRGAGLINNLLGIEEKAFKSTDTMVRRQAFLSWSLLIDNFALDPQELATPRRVKLLCIPLSAKNSKTELIAITKLEVWWHLIVKLYKDIDKFVNPVITQFLNFCFGPLGDTPLLSTKCDVVASPGKRFFKTKLAAIDALFQLLVSKSEDFKILTPVLEERLPHAVSCAFFQECYKSLVHSVAETLLVLDQLSDQEFNNRQQVAKVLWKSLINHVQGIATESKKGLVYKDVILVVTELGNHATVSPFIRNVLLDVILLELVKIPASFTFWDTTLNNLISVFTALDSLKEINKNHCNAIECLLWQGLKSKVTSTYLPNTLQILRSILDKVKSAAREGNNINGMIELWCILAEIATVYMEDAQEINEGDAATHSFATIESFIEFPVEYVFMADATQVQDAANAWRNLYKQFDLQAELIATVKPNEILTNTTIMIQNYINKDKRCCSFAVYCLDALLNTISYKCLLAMDEVPPIVQLVNNLTKIVLTEGLYHEAEFALKALSALVITVYGHDPQKLVKYFETIRPAIELMLTVETGESLLKEIASTWETVVSVLRGLNKLLSVDLLTSYRKIIELALHHPNANIENQALLILELRDNLEENAKNLLKELSAQIMEEKSTMKKKHAAKERDEKVEKPTKQMRLAGSFLNRKPVAASPKTVLMKNKEKEEKKAPLPPEPDSQDYVFIKTDLKFDVARFTEHQKETLKRRRDDIPAMYNDLSQSSSQDSQNLQKWFDGKINQTDKSTKEQTSSVVNAATKISADHEANKENKVDGKTVGTEISEKLGPDKGDGKSAEVNEQNVSSASAKDSDRNEGKESAVAIVAESPSVNDISDVTSEADVTPIFKKTFDATSEKKHDDDQPPGLMKPVAKKLDFESREEFPEDKEQEQESSPSIIEGTKRRGRSFAHRSASPEQMSSENNTPHPEESTSQDAVKPRGRGRPPKNCATDENVPSEESNKGVKRKASSDSEAEGSAAGRKRRKSAIVTSSEVPSDTDSVKSTESEQSGGSRNADFSADVEGFSRRTKNEISRLRINMVFDGSPSSRRRSKLPEESVDKGKGKRNVSPDAKIGRLRSAENSKKASSSVQKAEKKLKAGSAQKYGGKREKQDVTKATEVVETDETVASTSAGNPCTGKKAVAEEPKSKMKRNLKEKQEAAQDKTRVEQDKELVSVSKEHKEEASHETAIVGESQRVTDSEKLEEEDQNTGTLNSKNESHSVEPKDTEDQEEDSDNIIESSQESNVDSMLGRINNKKCFTKINKAPTPPNQNALLVPGSSGNESNITKQISSDTITEEGALRQSGKEFKDDDTVPGARVDDIAAEGSTVKKLEDSHITAKSITSENPSKPYEMSPTTKSSLNAPAQISSPKGNSVKRFPKSKTYPSQGRAAHMLGLVTKQALAEGENQNVRMDEEQHVATRRSKARDSDNDVSVRKDRMSAFKESEKIASPSGRQEKMFSNMRSPEYSAQTSIKSFSNLRNDGEKLSPRMERTIQETATSHINSSREKEDDVENSSLLEKEDLPMLEWSSANPPSLSASPSVSILKRQRMVIPDSEQESITPSKRKRVSFADPPVSKEMGYEITSTGCSPHKINKLSLLRGSLIRKEASPVRLRQTKLKFIQVDSGKKSECENDGQQQIEKTNEIDSQCEMENELLTKIADDLEYSENMPIDDETQSSFVAEGSVSADDESKRVITDSLATDREIVTDARTEEAAIATGDAVTVKTEEDAITIKTEEDVKVDADHMERILGSIKGATSEEESETQQDMFGSIGLCDGNAKVEALNKAGNETKELSLDTTETSTSGPLKFNISDSIVGGANSSKGESSKSSNLDDTVDIQNVTGLNFSTNSDELLCVKPVRTSTRGPDATEEFDTLTATDSVFSNLPISQDSQATTQNNVELSQDELLDSTLSIYPSLIMCEDPIAALVPSLANPLWAAHLSIYFNNRGIKTVGDLAELSEREVNRIPVKGSPKVDFVRSVLNKFEGIRLLQISRARSQEAKAATPEKSISSVTASTPLTETAGKASYVKSASRKLTAQGATSAVKKAPPAALGSASTSASATTTIFKLSQQRHGNPADLMESKPAEIESSLPDVAHYRIASVSPNRKADPLLLPEPMSRAAESNATLHFIEIPPSEALTSDPLLLNPISMDSAISLNPTLSLPALNTSSLNTTATQNTRSTSSRSSQGLISTASSSDYDARSRKATRSVSVQMALEDLLDEIDVNLVLHSAVKRSTPENVLMEYKMKMRHMHDAELERETIRMLGIESRLNQSDVTLKTACKACGVNKVLIRLPDIFSADKQFFAKVLSAYRMKLKVSDCLSSLDFNEIKDAVCQKCSSSELAEMLSKTLKEEEKNGITKPMTELSSLNAMLKRMPMDLIISNTVANEEIIPAPLVLDIALQNNSPSAIVHTLEAQSSIRAKEVFDRLCTLEALTTHIEEKEMSEESLFEIFKAVSAKFTAPQLLKAFNLTMEKKLVKEEPEVDPLA